MISIDGGEGGGQMLRTAIGMSALTGKSVEVTNIRARRPKPGLQAQHLAGLQAVARLCDAEMEGASLGSATVRFNPGRIKGGRFDIDVGTAGSLTLVLQAAMLPVVFAPKPVVLRLTGGTDVSWSPPIDYFKEVFLPAIRQFCPRAALTIIRRGYYPAGGGIIELKVTPGLSRSAEPLWERFAPIVAAKVPLLERTSRGALVGIKGVAHASASLTSKKVAERAAESARLNLSSLGIPVDIATEYPATANPGAGITLWAVFSDSGEIEDAVQIGASSLLGAAPTPEAMGENAGRELLRHIKDNCALDPYLADQLVPWLALAGSGAIRAELTPHAATNIAVVERFLGKKFVVEKDLLKRA